jgi:hypothetical protein
LDALDAHDHLEALLSSYSRYESDTKHNMKAAQEIGDSETLELLQVISVSIENNLWFLEAYLEGVAIGLHGGRLPRWISAFSNPQKTCGWRITLLYGKSTVYKTDGFWRDPRPTGLTRAVWANKPGKRPAP